MAATVPGPVGTGKGPQSVDISEVPGSATGPVDVPPALAALTRVRAAAADLERAERAAIEAARAGGATWRQIAAALGMRGRTGAQKRYTDLARRLSAPRQSAHQAPLAMPEPSAPQPRLAVADPPAAMRPREADAVRDDAGPDSPPPGGQEPAAPPAGQERAAARHRPVPEIGPEWTITQPSGPGGDVVLWRDGVRVGTAGRAGLTRGWTATRDSGGTVTGLGVAGAASRYPTRIKALSALAVDHEAARRRTRRRAAGSLRP